MSQRGAPEAGLGNGISVEFADSIEPERALPGVEVVYAFPNNGYDHDQRRANERLEVGAIYRLKSAVVDNWQTEVWLEGFDVSFNSVLFAEVER